MRIVSFPITEEAAKMQKAVQRGLLEYFDGKRTVRVRLDPESAEKGQPPAAGDGDKSPTPEPARCARTEPKSGGIF